MRAMDGHEDEREPDELVVHLGNLFSQLQSSELLVRRRDPAGVHQMRVGLRTMRSLLATYRPLIRDPDGIQELRAELGWLSGELATARDLEVVRQRLLPEAGEAPGLTKLIEDALGTAKDLTRDRVVAALDSERYAALQRNLADALRGPGLLVEHTTMAAELRGLVLHEVRRLRGRMRQALRANTDEERSLALHDVRKAAKRVRYAAEALQTTYGKPARRLARRAALIQTELGEVQDAAVCRAFLRELSGTPGITAEQTRWLTVLLEDQRRHALQAERRYAREGRHLRKRGPATAWLGQAR